MGETQKLVEYHEKMKAWPAVGYPPPLSFGALTTTVVQLTATEEPKFPPACGFALLRVVVRKPAEASKL